MQPKTKFEFKSYFNIIYYFISFLSIIKLFIKAL